MAVSEKKLSDFACIIPGRKLTDNAPVIRHWHEIPLEYIDFSPRDGVPTHPWMLIHKNCSTFRWYGTQSYIADCSDKDCIRQFIYSKDNHHSNIDFSIPNIALMAKNCLSWTKDAHGRTIFLYIPDGTLINPEENYIFFEDEASLFYTVGFLNTRICDDILQNHAPHTDACDLTASRLHSLSIPWMECARDRQMAADLAKQMIYFMRTSWNETPNSPLHSCHPMLETEGFHDLDILYSRWNDRCMLRQIMIDENEQTLERMFSEASGSASNVSHQSPTNSSLASQHCTANAEAIWMLAEQLVMMIFGKYQDHSQYENHCHPAYIIVQRSGSSLSHYFKSILANWCPESSINHSIQWLCTNLYHKEEACSLPADTALQNILFDQFYAHHLHTFEHRPCILECAVSDSVKIWFDYFQINTANFDGLINDLINLDDSMHPMDISSIQHLIDRLKSTSINYHSGILENCRLLSIKCD